MGVASALLVSVFFLFVDLDGVVRGRLHPLAILFIAVWWFPFYVFLRHVRGRTVALLGWGGLLGATLWGLIDMFRGNHSTAAIGTLIVPFLVLLPAALVLLAIDGSLSELVPARRNRSSER